MALFRRKRSLADIMKGFCDIHCHLLPCVDDGSHSAEDSMNMLFKLEELGVKAIYTTPHIINGVYGSRDEEFMRDEFSKFKYDGTIDLRLAAEYFIDDKFLEHIKSSPLTFADKNILVEFGLNNYNLNSYNILFETSLAGYNIIIAHPERYSFIQNDRNGFLEKLIDSGYKLQLNMLSLTGFHGSSSKSLSMKLLEEGKYDFVGTDIHSESHISAIKNSVITERTFTALERLKLNNEVLF